MRTDVLRLVWLLACASVGVHAAVPGGMEVRPVPADTAEAWYLKKRVLVLRDPEAIAVVGVPLGLRHASLINARTATVRTAYTD